MVSWAYVWYRADGRLSLEQTSAELTNLILDMVGARSGAALKPGRVAAKAAGKPDRVAATKGRARVR